METKNSHYQLAMRFGLYYSLASIIIDIVFFILNLNPSLNWLNGILKLTIGVTVIYLGMKARRDDELGGYISYSSALGFGSIMVLLSALVLSVYAYIHMTFVDPEGIDRVMKEVKEQLILKNSSEEEIEMSLSMMRKMKSPAFSVPMAFIGGFVWGFILSLIIAIFVRKNDPNAEYNSLNS
ncbi:MAG: DUF4199 domain-containing protein [Bacteroidetes bacterium]|nr:DUF4199 domain-containing protein [Bacteroidota bacterium]